MIRFEICRDRPGVCRDEADIMAWLNRKFLIVLENYQEFQKETVEEVKVKKSSRLIWNVVSP